MRRSPFILVLAAALAASCAPADAPPEDPTDEPAAGEPAPVYTDSSVMMVPGDVDTTAAAVPSYPDYPPDNVPVQPRLSPPDLGKDSLPAGSGRGKGRPPRRSDSLPADLP
jgi:hypothetical protein